MDSLSHATFYKILYSLNWRYGMGANLKWLILWSELCQRSDWMILIVLLALKTSGTWTSSLFVWELAQSLESSFVIEIAEMWYHIWVVSKSAGSFLGYSDHDYIQYLSNEIGGLEIQFCWNWTAKWDIITTSVKEDLKGISAENKIPV